MEGSVKDKKTPIKKVPDKKIPDKGIPSKAVPKKVMAKKASPKKDVPSKAVPKKATQNGATQNRKATNRSISAERRKRINRLKKMIIGFIIVAILIPNIICVFLGVRISSLKGKLAEAETNMDKLLVTIADGVFNFYRGDSSDSSNDEAGETFEEEFEEWYDEIEIIDEESTRKVYLTFDDGPSTNTERILEILDEYGVKATFFVTGEYAETHPERYCAIVQGGHTIGMHSYSHRYSEIYESIDAFGADLLKLQKFIEIETGVTPTLYRFPGGSSNTVSKLPMSEFCDYLTDNGITYFDWNMSSKDATSPMRSVEEIVDNCTAELYNYKNAVILLHDSQNKTSTVEALPLIIETIQQMDNTEILPITDETVTIHH